MIAFPVIASKISRGCLKGCLLGFLGALLLVTGGCVSTKKAPSSLCSKGQWGSHQKWWVSLNDPLLNIWADDLLKQNIDIQMAEAKLKEAHGAAIAQQSAFFPEINGSIQGGRGDALTSSLPRMQSMAQGGFYTQWELDLFGRNRWRLKSAVAQMTAAQARIEEVKNTLIAELAKATLEMREAQRKGVEIRGLLASQKTQVDVLTVRVQAGLMDASFLHRAQAQRAQTATQLPLAQAAFHRALYRIEKILALKGSEGLYTNLASQVQKAGSLALAVPEVDRGLLQLSLQTIRERPDVRAARAQLLAAQSNLRQAEAELWPKLSIGGFAGLQDSSLPLSNVNPIWSLTSALTFPVLNFGRIHGQIKSADAQAQHAALGYENAVLNAVQETKSALSDYVESLQAAQLQYEALLGRQQTVRVAQERFERGLTDMTDLTTAQTELDQATLLYIERKTFAAMGFIRLHKALGTSVACEVAKPFGGSL